MSVQMSRKYPHSTTKVPVSDKTVEVLAIRLDEKDEILQSSFAILTNAEQERANRFVFAHDRRRFTIARARLKQFLAARLEATPESIELSYGEYGKPKLAGQYASSNLRFNISHCDDVAVYAFTYGRDIGVDVEQVRVLPDADDVAKRFFSSSETSTYLQLNPQEKPQGFFNCWTRKEAFIKAIGEGFSHPLDRFDVSLTPGEPAKILRIDNTPGTLCNWEIQSFEPVDGYIGAVVRQKTENKSCLREIAAEKTPTQQKNELISKNHSIRLHHTSCWVDTYV